MGLESIGMSDEDKKGKQLYIDPTECINCSACLPECPVDAIVSTEEIAIQMGERQSVIDNYAFFGLKYLENH
jgi:formate hydrogenlyase subunit 6/NADH:ubiquinone oxidoreductase subunit I